MKKSSQNSKIELSIVIVNYNTGGLLKKCVESIVRSTNNLKNPNTEILIVDNGSSDGSTKSIKGAKGINGIEIIENTTNLGFARANNQGIKQAKGEYVLLLNPDIGVKGGAIGKLLKFANTHTDAGVAGAKLILRDGTTQKSVFRFPTVWRAIAEFWLGANSYSSYAPQGVNPTTVDAVVGAVFLITPQALAKVGLLDERYFMYFEDLDYCRRVWNSGLKVYYLPSAEIIHYHGVSGKNIEGEQWRRLIPGSKIYNGVIGHWLINFIIWTSQKLK